MTDLKRHPQTITAPETESILSGVRVEGKPELDQLAALMAGVRRMSAEVPDREVIEAQLAVITELLDRTRPRAEQYALAAQADRTVEPVRYALMSRIYDRTMGTLRRRAYALSTAMLIATGSAAAAGVLPDAAQEALADAAARVGVTLPQGGADAHDPDEPGPSDTHAKPASEKASEVAIAVHEVIATKDQYGNGRDFGQAVAEAARDAARARREARQSNAKAGTPATEGTVGPPSEPGSQGDQARANARGGPSTSAKSGGTGTGRGPDLGRERADEARGRSARG